MDPDLLLSLKALADRSRLRVAGALAGKRPVDAAILSTELGMQPVDLGHHLARLVKGGLVAERQTATGVRYGLKLERLAEIGRALDALSRDGTGDADSLGAEWPGYEPAEARVLRAFIVDGRLESIPAQERKRQVILRYLAQTVFVSDREYPEKEVNMRLALLHPDVASLRRYLVDLGYMSRSAGIYKLQPASEWPAREPEA